ncbi:MAG: response regulator [Armatimonadetes bacterium]|nr:response regulator [Armatimonadota bacterium]
MNRSHKHRQAAESRRLEALHSLRILESGPRPDLDEIALAAARIFDVEAAVIALVDENHVRFKARFGIDESEVKREHDLCARVIESDSVLVCEELEAHPDVCLPSSTSQGPFNFFVGIPLCTREGHRIGALCLWDSKSRQLLPAQLKTLEFLAQMVMLAIQLDESAATLHRDAEYLGEIDRQNRELELIFDSMHEGIVVQDKVGQIFKFNQAACDILGLTADELCGRTSIDPRWRAMREDRSDFPGIEHPSMIALKTGEPQLNVLMGLNLRDGTERWITINAIPLFTAGESAPYQVMCTFADITANRLYQDDLIQSREAERSANQAKSAFLAAMSHEIRTPLHGVIGMTELILESDLDASQRTIAETVVNSGKHLLGIVNDILDFSKIEAGKMTLESVDTELVDCTEAFLKPLRYSAEAKGLKLLFRSNLAQINVKTDPSRFGQIVTNLVGNAIKFTSEGSITVDVHAELANEIVKLTVKVIDTGVGVPDSAIPSLFQPFKQADVSTTRVFGGTGLGLAISSRIAQQMGGDLCYSHNPAGGSIFQFTAWFVPCQASVAVTSRGSEVQPLRGHILVAEDNPVNQMVLSRNLDRLGCTYEIVGDGQLALDALARSRFDVVLMDCMMPVMDGYEAAKLIRSSEDADLRRIPMIAVTANTVDDDLQECLASGFNDFLTKPFGVEQLYAKLSSFLDQQATPRSA